MVTEEKQQIIKVTTVVAKNLVTEQKLERNLWKKKVNKTRIAMKNRPSAVPIDQKRLFLRQFY